MKLIHRSLLAALSAWAASLRAEPDVVIEDRTFTTGENASFWATYTLQTFGTVVVQDGASLRLHAGNIIRLAPGFRLDPGGSLRIQLQSAPVYNPGGYYDFISPTLVPVQSFLLSGAANTFNPNPLVIAVWNQDGTAPLVGAPVMVTVEDGDGWLSTDTNGAPLAKTLELFTDQDGTVTVYLKNGPYAGAVTLVRAIAGSQTYLFREADSDGDGIPDAVEIAMGLNPNTAAQVITSESIGFSVFMP